MKKIQNTYIKKRIEEMKPTWERLFFGSREHLVTITDYKNPAGQINSELESCNIHRISRDYTNNIKKGLFEMQFVISQLSKTYKQEILDSNQFTNLFEELLEVGSRSKHTQIERYGIASNLFLISMKILIENSPLPLQRKLSNLMVDFIDLYNLPLELTKKETAFLIIPTFRYETSGNVIVDLGNK